MSIAQLFDKTHSWVKNQGHTKIALHHEQIHFFITVIKAYEFANTVREFHFSADNYSKELEQLQSRYQKEMEQMQTRYYKETNHGTILTKQVEWETNIEMALKEKTAH